MEGKIKYMPEFDECFRMPVPMIPPPSVHFFKPGSIRVYYNRIVDQIFLGKEERLIFEGEQNYTLEEKKKLQEFFKYMKENKLQCNEM